MTCGFSGLPYVDMVWGGVSTRCPRCASAVGELPQVRRLMSVEGGMKRSFPQLLRERPLAEPGGRRADLVSEEIRVYDEAIDDAEAAALGRARIADGRRIELNVEELAPLLHGGRGKVPGAGRHGQADMA